ncbi:MAG: NDP-sugar synthase [Myxococcota bacterium]
MRAMIVGAGLGTRLQPLTALRPKPALPVGGVPLVAYTLAWLHAHGVREVVINVHHLPEILEATARRHCPPGMELRFSREQTLLGTGGGIARVADFLRESDPCLVIGGDMLMDADLSALVALHRERGDALTMLLREEPRMRDFGSIGVDAAGRIRRIATRLDLGEETRAGLYTWVNVVSSRAFDSMPGRDRFNHLDDWIAPLLVAGARDIRGELDLPCRWEPVGTLPEYLQANLAPPELSYLAHLHPADAPRAAREGGVVLGAGAHLAPEANLERAVVWDGEHVPNHVQSSDGVFAGGRFHSIGSKEKPRETPREDGAQ